MLEKTIITWLAGGMKINGRKMTWINTKQFFS
jgi:hypothetical protein